MELTDENYFSEYANYEYMSVSQYKMFVGSYGREGCEACAMAQLRGEFSPPPSAAMLVGSYVDAYYEGREALDKFRAEHPEILKKDGTPKADFVKAEKVIARTKQDALFQAYMDGEKQVIMTGELFGTPWKIKIDSYHPGKAIVDLKVMQSLTKFGYVRDYGYMDFIRYWGYDIQGAVYQEIVRQNTGKTLPFYIAGASKEDAVDIEVIYVNDTYLQEALRNVERNMPRVLAVKSGQEEPERCGKCDYCRMTKVLKAPIGIADLQMRI